MLVDLINQRKRYFAVKRAKERRNKPMTKAQQMTYMSNHIKRIGSYTLKHLKKLSFDEIKELFEATMRKEELKHEGSKKQKTSEASGSAQEQPGEEEKELSQEDLQQLMIIVPEQGMNVEALKTKYPIIDLEIYTEDTRKYWKIIRVGNHTEVYQFFKDMLKIFDKDDLVMLWSLVKERFSSTEPTDDKEKALWVELKRLFEPDIKMNYGNFRAIFHKLIEEIMEVFMDDFSVFGNSFDHFLKNIKKMLKRCEETNLVLNWEKCHFMVKEGIVLDHQVSGAGIEVDKEKIEAISKITIPHERKSYPKLSRTRWFLQKIHKRVLTSRTPNDPTPGASSEMRQHKSFGNVIADPLEDIMGTEFMGPFPSPNENKYILVAIDYVSKWVKAQAFPTSDARNILNFLKRLFARFGIPKALISDRGTHFCNYHMENSMKRVLKVRWYGPFSISKDMKNGAIELYDEDGNKFIVNKQRVKPYQKNVLDTNRDDDITLDNEGEVTKFLIKKEKEFFTDGVGINTRRRRLSRNQQAKEAIVIRFPDERFRLRKEDSWHEH
uniref:RNA-directed DNA polymerase homolog n=1 Tax=Tanacetum cinerariifolium TaxID=118510 RepID=A0A6L2KHZ2_TANCI|nr:RNA-directed DNA polymerase homolog [Tanacetum cinerariifolium]